MAETPVAHAHHINWGQHAQFLREHWLTLGPEGCAARLSEMLGRPVSVNTVKSAATRLRTGGYPIPCIPHGAGKRRSSISPDLSAEIRRGRAHWTADDTHEVSVTVSQLIRSKAQRTGCQESLVAVEIMHAALHAAMKGG
jgi:hypothetical protein